MLIPAEYSTFNLPLLALDFARETLPPLLPQYTVKLNSFSELHHRVAKIVNGFQVRTEFALNHLTLAQERGLAEQARVWATATNNGPRTHKMLLEIAVSWKDMPNMKMFAPAKMNYGSIEVAATIDAHL